MVYSNQVAGYLALLMVVGGCAILHARVRSLDSLSLLLSLAAVIVWGFWAQAAVEQVLFLDSPADSKLAAFVRRYNILPGWEAVLMLWFGASFLLAARRVRPQRRA